MVGILDYEHKCPVDNKIYYFRLIPTVPAIHGLCGMNLTDATKTISVVAGTVKGSLASSIPDQATTERVRK